MNSSILKSAVLLVTAGLLAGCSGFGQSDVGSVYQLAKRTWSGGGKVTLQQAAAVPYASMGLRIGSSNEIMLILATDNDGSQLWTSSARIAITTLHGRIIQFAGLGRSTSRLPQGPDQGPAAAQEWLADFPDVGMFSVGLHCEPRGSEPQTIVILGTEIRTRKIQEDCSTNRHQMKWKFRNTYWVDADDGFVWRSIQHVSPKLDPVELEVLRRPAG